MKPVTDQELKEALKTEQWLNECDCDGSPRPTAMRRSSGSR